MLKSRKSNHHLIALPLAYPRHSLVHLVQTSEACAWRRMRASCLKHFESIRVTVVLVQLTRTSYMRDSCVTEGIGWTLMFEYIIRSREKSSRGKTRSALSACAPLPPSHLPKSSTSLIAHHIINLYIPYHTLAQCLKLNPSSKRYLQLPTAPATA